jgi:hypothetical protein
MAQLFGDERCTPAILEFLAQTEVGTTGRLQARRFGSGEDSGGAAHGGSDSDPEEDGDDGGTGYEDGRVSMEHEAGVGT